MSKSEYKRLAAQDPVLLAMRLYETEDLLRRALERAGEAENLLLKLCFAMEHKDQWCWDSLTLNSFAGLRTFYKANKPNDEDERNE